MAAAVQVFKDNAIEMGRLKAGHEAAEKRAADEKKRAMTKLAGDFETSVGAIVAITYKSALDDPGRIKKSKNAGPLFGLTPKRYQSGETDITGGISRVGDQMVRTALYEAANVLLSRVTRFSALKRWGLEVAKRRGLKRAKVAVARKLAVILHRMWINGSTFRWTKTEAAHA